MLERIHWLGHSSFSLQGPPLIYIDPVGITRNAFLADVILISQASYDHCSALDVQKLSSPETIVVGNDEVTRALEDVSVRVLRPWQSLTVERARITAVAAAETSVVASPALEDDRRGTPPASLGYLISLDYYDLYYAGATVVVPEIEIHPDIAILPVRDARSGLTSIDDSVAAIRQMQPRWVIPSHWSSGPGGGFLDVKAFQAAIGDLAEVVIPDQIT
jgi:L-ascorbate metabolism protein UlaG (beta-lactamase superfamily)